MVRRADRRKSVALAVFVALAALSGPSPGAPDAEAKMVKDMLKDVAAAEKAGKCEEALAILKQIAAIRELAEATLHVGECEARQGRLLEAQRTWERAEDQARAEKDKATLQALPGKLEALRARIPTIQLRIVAEAKGVKVTIDDQPQPLERVATPLRLNPGDHTLTVSAEGRSTFTKTLKLMEKDAITVAVELPPLVSKAPVPERPRTVPLASWIAGGTSLALVAGGVVSFVAADSAASDGQARCARSATCDPSAQSTVRTLDATALGLWMGAGAAAGFAVTVWALQRPKPSGRALAERPPARFVVGPTGAAVDGSF